jgi:hypothetical protein
VNRGHLISVFSGQLTSALTQLKVRVAERLGQLLFAFCRAYALLVCLGLTPAGQAARADLEVLRQQPRHGTRRTLSVLSIAMLTHARHTHAPCARWPPSSAAGRRATSLRPSKAAVPRAPWGLLTKTLRRRLG